MSKYVYGSFKTYAEAFTYLEDCYAAGSISPCEVEGIRAAKAASGGTTYDRTAKYSPDVDPADVAQAIIAEFSRWAECSRQRYLAA